MRALVERVHHAAVEVEGRQIGVVGEGFLVYVGVEKGDTDEDVQYLVEKIRSLRIFEDEEGKMNLDITQKGGELLVISAFTLQADARKGRRPSFDHAAEPILAEKLYETVIAGFKAHGLTVQTGRFGAMMAVSAVNNGPICVLLDSKKLF